MNSDVTESPDEQAGVGVFPSGKGRLATVSDEEVGSAQEDATEPTPHRGLSVADFKNPGIFRAVKRAIRLLPPGRRRLLFLASGIQISLGLLDLLGIILIGLLAAVAVSGIGAGSTMPPQAQSILERFGLGDLTVSQLSVIVALTAVFILVLKTALSAVMARRITRFLANRQAEVSAKLAREFLARPLADVQRWTTPEAIYALGGGVGAATVSLLGAAITISAELFLFLIVGVTLLVYDPVLTLITIALFTGIVFLLHNVLGNWTARNARTMTDASIDTLTAVSEALSTYRETTVLNRRDLYVSRYESLIGRYASASASTAYIMEIPKYVLEATLYFGVLLLATVQFLTKDLSAAAATVAVFLAAGSRVVPAMLRLQGAGITIRNASVQAQPTFFLADFLEEAEQRDSTENQQNRPRMTATKIHDHIVLGYPDFEARIEVRHVSLTYSDAAEPALSDASLTAPAGSSVALVGPTGAGKSTLADVILGVMQPQLGEVTISGVSPREAIERWPGAISYVPQSVALVYGSIRDNVALGLPREAIDDELVWDALERAHLADFLRDNREGLDTTIGERGFRLSGGQRQRLGIARALYTRPKLLVLDEATSALDAETEQAIIQTLSELVGEVTTITVAHRLATVRMVDQLLYLQDGKVIASGAFEDVRNAVPDFDRQASLLGL
jgi:ABC-type bacteriocin/lantibiotic exporter with double-glycine peptidase domain